MNGHGPQPHRVPKPRGGDGPGPGDYETSNVGTVGAKSPDSRKPTANSFSFGSASRDSGQNTYMDRATDRAGGKPQMLTHNADFLSASVSGVGTKVQESKRPTSPSFSFGRAPRDQVAGQFLSREHARSAPSTTTLQSTSYLSPDASLTSSSTKPRAPAFGFGSSTRESWNKVAGDKATQRPGAKPSTVTAQADFHSSTGDGIGTKGSTRPTTPSFSFGRAPRDQYHRTYLSREHQRGIPGTAALQSTSFLSADGADSIGGRTLTARANSRRPTSPAYGFGTASRDAFDKTYGDKATARPGARPTTLTSNVEYMPDTVAASTGKQVSSTKRTSPQFGFGTSSREHVHSMVLKPHF